MNLYLLSQNTNNGYDTYDSMVVIAPSKEEAVKLSIYEYGNWDWSDSNDGSNILIKTISENITTEYEEAFILLTSFNAG